MAPRNRDERLNDFLVKLRRHLLKCYDCKGAIEVGTSGTLCMIGALLTVSAAREFTSVIELRRKANSSGTSYIHACPDLSKHGASYALTAPMFTVVGVQEELF
jgi:hypothetical protein